MTTATTDYQQTDPIQSNNGQRVFKDEDRLDDLPALNEQNALDDLFTEQFGFVPKVFTGTLFNVINEAIYETVASVEEAVTKSYYPEQREKDDRSTIEEQGEEEEGYPNKNDIAKSLNQLESLLCSSIDNRFDLLEIWLHRNIFTFTKKNLTEMIEKFKSSNDIKLLKLLLNEEQEQEGLEEEGGRKGKSNPNKVEEIDWENNRLDEIDLWSKIENCKNEYLQSKDDYLSLIEVSKTLDSKLASLKSISNQIDEITIESKMIYDSKKSKPIELIEQVGLIQERFSEIKIDEQIIKINQQQQQEAEQSLRKSKDDDDDDEIHKIKDNDHNDDDVDDDEEGEEQNFNSNMIKYHYLINRITKSKINDMIEVFIQNQNHQHKNHHKNEIDDDEVLLKILNSLKS